MAISTAAIRTSIVELLTGENTAATRPIHSGVFATGTFDGQSTTAKQAISMQTTEARHRFNTTLGRARDSGATSISATGNRRLVDIDVTISITSRAATQAQADARDALLDSIMSDLEDAVQALSMPGNLRTTLAGTATNISSGLMRGPTGDGCAEYRMVRQDWDNQLIESEITGLITIAVAANT